jgi:CBS domain containing-hemolysin-like protein
MMAAFLPFLIIFALILVNGLYVAAEFSIIGVRPSRVEQLAEEGSSLAGIVKNVIDHPRRMDRYIATAQLGITLASLGLGMYGEPHIAHLIEGPLHDWFGIEGEAVHTISFIFALTVITYLHIVIGEMVPKSLALGDAEGLVLLLAIPMRVSESVLSWAVTILNRIGFSTLRLLGVPPPGEGGRLYTSEELAFIVTESVRGGLVEATEGVLIENIFYYADRRAGQIMTPRVDVDAVPVDIQADALLDRMLGSPHSRFPVYEGTLEHIRGVLHLKDILRQSLNAESYDLKSLLRKPLIVPETMPLDILLDTFRKERQHLAIVIDEYGRMEGVVTLEDLIEEVVGEVWDEFDEAEQDPVAVIGPGHLLVQGSLLVEDLEDYLTIPVERHAVQTVGGLVMAILGRLPREGDAATIGEVTLRVDVIEERRIREVTVRFPPEQAL